ncbi:MAG: response regulator [Alphaproteobacteria bacterium]|nr:response regulator [Alphaproteobacteria bacterium]
MSNENALDLRNDDKSHILVIDDDKRICALVSRYLHDHDFIVMTAENAANAENLFEHFDFDMLVVDVMMPGKTGLELVRDLRKKGNDIPVLLLTALGEAGDRISGLESGADDYLSKPFEPQELVLRIKSILKRVKKVNQRENIYRIGEWIFNVEKDELTRGQERMPLTTMEANLLRALALKCGEVLSRQELADLTGLDAGERTIDVQVTRLRRKIEESSKLPRFLQTVRGKGYILRAEKA